MKPRKVVLTMELETDAKLSDLRDKMQWIFPDGSKTMILKQIQANVVKDEK